MSLYQFFASDKKLDEYDNGLICLKNEKLINPKRKVGGFVTESDESNSIRIIFEDDMKEASLYTNKKNCAYIEWLYSDKNATLIIEYIEKQLQKSKQIELWNVWLGYEKEPQIRKYALKDLTIADIKDIWGKEYFAQPECLIIKNESMKVFL